MKSHHITEVSSQIYAHFASEHQPRRQKICKRELLISTDRKTLEKVILRLRCLGAKIFVVNMTHEFQAMSTIQEIIELIILQICLQHNHKQVTCIVDKVCCFEIKHTRSGKCFSFALEVQRKYGRKTFFLTQNGLDTHTTGKM